VTTGNRDGIFGFHAGAQLQWGAWVLGAEAARIACFNECSSTSDVLPVNLGFDENTFGQHKITNLVTAGPRLGYAWDRLLVFTTLAALSGHFPNMPECALKLLGSRVFYCPF